MKDLEGRMDAFSSLSLCYLEKNSPWNLSLDGSGIRRSSYTESWANYLQSFFSNDHVRGLRERASSLCSRVSGIDLLSEKQKILLEKISVLVFEKNPTWLYGISAPLNKVQRAEVEIGAFEKEGLIEPLKENGRFVNFSGEKIWSQFLETLRLLFPGALSKHTNLKDLSALRADWQPLARSESAEITWLGHATILLQTSGMNLLFDPAFEDVGILFKRHVRPGIEAQDLPLLDFIGVSHNHDDHCQQKVVKFLADNQPFAMVPKNFGSFFTSEGYANVKDTTWWETVTLKKEGKEVKITSIPAQHGSQRGVMDMNKSLWQGFVVQDGDKTIYIAGDTALKEGLFEQIHEVFGEIDLAILPIAPERELGVHLDCEQALIAFERLGAKEMLPYHFAGYRQAKEVLEDPYIRLKNLLSSGKYSHLEDQILLPKVGERFHLKQDKQYEKVSA